MSENKIERWLSIAERAIALIKPKFHNGITRTVVIFGLAIAVESQVNIFEAFGVAFYESIFGQSDYLRGLFSSATNSWIGVVFVVFGLIYNAIVTVGLELVQKYKDTIPKHPEFDFMLNNSDAMELKDKMVLRGKRCIHSITPIPDNESYSDRVKQKMEKGSIKYGGASSLLMGSRGFNAPRINKNFYNERAKFLRVWGGAEILRLSIFNSGEVLANNVRIELIIDKAIGLTVSNDHKIHPDLPVQETEESMYIPPHFNHETPVYDIKHCHTKTEYFFEWDVGNLQAKEEKKSDTRIFLRTESEINIKICIYCDQLPKPVSNIYTISPATEVFEFDLGLLKLNDKDFLNSIDPYVMGGYLGRYYDELLDEYDQNTEALLP